MIYNQKTNTVTEEIYVEDANIPDWDNYIIPYIKKMSETLDFLPKVERIQRFGSRVAIERQFIKGFSIENIVKDEENIAPHDLAQIYTTLNYTYPGVLNESYYKISKKSGVHIYPTNDLSKWILDKKQNLKYVGLKNLLIKEGLLYTDLQQLNRFNMLISNLTINEYPEYKRMVKNFKDKSHLVEMQRRGLRERDKIISESIHKDKLRETFGINLYKQLGFAQIF